MSEVVYANFLLLYVGVTILASEHLCATQIDYAEEIIKIFVRHFADIYGTDMLVYNVHALTHLASDTRLYGHCERFCAFPFENYLQVIKKLIRKPNFPLQQVIRRLHEKKQVKRSSSHSSKYCKKKHSSGPLPSNFPHCSQFREAHLEHHIISSQQGNNAVMFQNNIFQVRNVATVNKSIILICQKFGSKEPFFQYPLDSSKLNVVVVRNLEQDLVHFPTEEISAKVVLLPYKDGYVSIPVIHTM